MSINFMNVWAIAQERSFCMRIRQSYNAALVHASKVAKIDRPAG